jgi:hypothetical protein
MRISFGGSITVPSQSERWFSEIRAGRAFNRGVVVVAGAAQIAEVQLLNPVASGKQAMIYSAMFSSNVNDQPQLRRYDTALATLVGNGVNLLAGGAASVCEIRTAIPAATDGSQLLILQTLASSPQALSPVWIAELSPGQGYLITGSTAVDGICAVWWWNEV